MTYARKENLFLWLCSLAGATMLMLSGPSALAEPYQGPYVGATLGYQSLPDADGLVYGGYAGFNLKATPRLVLGAEFGLAGATASRTNRVETATHVTVIEDSLGIGISLAGRIGWLVGDRTLLFGRAGWDNVQQRQVQTRTPKPPVATPGPETFKVKAFADSAIVGGGIEHYVTDRVSLRLDYDWAPAFERHQLRLGVGYSF